MDSRRKLLDHGTFYEVIRKGSGIAFGDEPRLFKHPPTEAR
jgi:hypothetical protein